MSAKDNVASEVESVSDEKDVLEDKGQNSESPNESASDDEFLVSLDILNNPTKEINKIYFLEISKYELQKIDKNKKKCCKIFKFETDWSHEEILNQIKTMDQKEFQNLFIFIIEMEDIEHLRNRANNKGRTFEQKLKILVQKFSRNRPIMLQVSSEFENKSKFYFKDTKMGKLQKIQNIYENYNTFDDFPSFLWMFLEGKIDGFKRKIEGVWNSRNSSIIYRFLRTLQINDNKFTIMILVCAQHGSQNDIKALMDLPLCDKNEDINTEIQNYFTTSYNLGGEYQSVLGNAISNTKLHDFVLKICSKIIGKFQYSFQLSIATTAFRKNQLDFLCNIIELCDFPFPNSLNISTVAHKGLKKIIEKRIKFNEAISEENKEEMEKYIKDYPHLKFSYNPSNSSALHHVISARKYELIEYLESFGFQAPEYDDYIEKTDDKGRKNVARQLATRKRRYNVNNADSNMNRTVLVLQSHSFIHNKNLSDVTRDIYLGKINEWFRHIYSSTDNKPHLDTAAQCDNLKIIFDFDSEEVKNIDPLASGSLGIVYPSSKWIFVGAKFEGGDEFLDKKIAGVLSHELYHYAMQLRYNNDCNPFLKHDIERESEYMEIVNSINEWKSKESDSPDDGCDGIISSVYTHYNADSFPSELIVRVSQILTQFAGDEQKLLGLEEKYKPLFDFHRNKIVPDLRFFDLKKRQEIQKINATIGQLEQIKSYNFEFSTTKNTNNLMSNQITIIATNTPKLLLCNIYKNSHVKFGNILDASNLFISTENLNNSDFLKIFKEILKKSADLNVIIDCSKGFSRNLKQINLFKKTKFALVASDKNQVKELQEILPNNSLENIDYEWSDLAEATKENLFKTEIIFFKNIIPIKDIYYKKIFNDVQNGEEGDKILPDRINDELFRLLVEKLTVNINKIAVENEEKLKDRKKFEKLFKERNFFKIKKQLDKSEETLRNENSKNLWSAEKKLIDHTKKYEVKNIQLTSTKIENIPLSNIEGTKTKMTQEQFMKYIFRKMYVLLSDNPGTGKTWTLQKIAILMCESHPERWTSFVDLKQFIHVFEVHENSEIIFDNFIAKKILKLETKYEEEIFYQMYENGDISILFDGFDEIAPNHVQIVVKLFKSLKFNNGNQVCISTRKFFEEKLQKELDVNECFNLEPFSDETSEDLVTSILIFNDLESENKFISKGNENNPSSPNYHEKAREICKIISGLSSNSIGAPLFYQMIADILSKIELKSSQISIFGIFNQFMKNQYERWTHKGEIRAEANKNSQDFRLNFVKLHEFKAMKGSYPNINRFCDLLFDSKEWPDEEIIACGILIKNGDEFQFQHETIREFFIAKFILRILKQRENDFDSDFPAFLRDALTNPKYFIVRIFLNESMKEYQGAVKPFMPEIAENIKILDFLLDIYGNNLENLQHIWSDYFATLDYDKLKCILLNDKNLIFKIARHNRLLDKFHEFPHFSLDYKDMYELLLHKDELGMNFVHLSAIYSHENFTKSLTLLEQKLTLIQIKSILNSKGYKGRNLLTIIVCTSKRKQNIEYVWNLIHQSCKSNENFLGIIKQVDDDGNNLFKLAACFTTTEIFNFMISELEKLYLNADIKELLSHKGNFKRNLLQSTAQQNESLEFNENLWNIMHKYFGPNEIFEMVTNTDEDGNKLIHNAVIGGKPEVVKQTWNEIVSTIESCFKENSRSTEIEKILNSKRYKAKNLLAIAVCNSENKQIIECVWNLLQHFCKSSEKFLQIIKQVDDDGNNVFDLAACFTTTEIFNFMVGELENLNLNNVVKEFLSQKGNFERNLLQSAAQQNESLEFNENLWNIMCKYFGPNEMFEMVKHADEEGYNLIYNAVIGDEPEVVKLTWSKILSTAESRIDEQSRLTEIEKILNSKSQKGRNLLTIAVCDSKNKKTFECVWNLIQQLCKSSEKFLRIIKQVDDDGDNVFDLAVCFTTTEIFNFMIAELEKLNLNDDIKELLSHIGNVRRNLLQSAANQNECLEFNENLWNIMCKYFCPNEVYEMVKHTDYEGFNLFYNAIIGNKPEVVKLTWSKIMYTLESCIDEQSRLTEIENILNSCRHNGKNLLAIAVCTSRYKQTIEYVWNLLQQLCNCKEKFLEIIKEVDDNGDNVFDIAVCFATTEIFNFMIAELEKINLNDDVKELLSHLGNSRRNLLQSAAQQNESSEFNENLWNIMHKYFSPNEIFEMVKHVDEDGNSLTHNAVFNDKLEVVKITWNKIIATVESCIDEERRSTEIEKILNLMGQEGSNLLATAIFASKNRQIIEYVWNLLQQLYNSNGKFFDIIKQVDDDGNNVFDLAACFTTAEIFNFMISELEKLNLNDDIKKLLVQLDNFNRNLLQLAVKQNESSEFIENLWNIVCKYFGPNEIFGMVKNTDKNGNNLMEIAILFRNEQFVELIWNKFLSFMSSANLNIAQSVVDELNDHVLNVLSNFDDTTAKKNLVVKLKSFIAQTEI